MAAEIRDELGNPVQLTDEEGNPVKVTDEHGNPVYLKGVATPTADTGTQTGASLHVPGSGTAGGYGEHAGTLGGILGGAGATAGHGVLGGKQATDQSHGYSGGVLGGKQTTDQSHGYSGGVGEQRQQQHHGDVTGEIGRSGSSSSSSEEDDGLGGRRKKKGLKEKIKDKLTGGKHKDDEQHQAETHGHGHAHTIAVGTAVTTTATTEPAEKKSMMDKIKDKLPGHHSH